jgi:arylsulfatase A-like enzyme
VITDLDAALQPVVAAVDRLKLRGNTYVIFTSDNGWFLGEHGFTSKVLPYEESIRVPLAISGPGVRPQVEDGLVLNLDLAPTVLELAGLPVPERMHGRSLVPLLKDRGGAWRESVLYQAPESELGSWRSSQSGPTGGNTCRRTM